jgi:hypothetical protein
MRLCRFALAILGALLLSESRATAGDEGEARIQPPKDKDDEPKGPHRELALFPIVGGSTDIGVQIGVGGVWSQVSPS